MTIVDIIKHYQRSIEKYSEDEKRILHCIGKLSNLPVEVAHLQETGVGRTINALRKYKGQVGDAARVLVAKWRAMVAAESESEGDADNVENMSNHSEENSMIIDEENSQQSGDDDEYEEPVQNNKESDDEKIENEKISTHEERKKHRKHDKHRDSSHKRHKSKHSKERHSDEPKSDHKSSKKSHKRKHDQPPKPDKHKRPVETDDSEHESPKPSIYVDENPKKDSKSKSHEPPESPPKSNCIEDKKSSSKRKHSDHNDHKVSKDKHKHHKSKHKDTESKSKHESDKSNKKHSDNNDKSDKKSKHKTEHKSKPHQKSNTKESKGGFEVNEDDDGGINSSSGASFAEALGMSSSPKKKKLPKLEFVKPKTPEIASPKENGLDLLAPNTKLPHLDLELTLPTISPNYHPSTSSSLYVDSLLNSSNSKPKLKSQEEMLSIAISSKNQRTKVYSGNKSAWGYVASLFDLCIRVLQDNIDALAYTGGVPYHILLPVLERATPEQLFELENYNPYFLDDTEPLWEQHCKREFRNKSRMEMETWREAYVRFVNEREDKLRALTANIKQSIDKSLPVRQTKLAYVDSVAKPPRNVIRKQAKFGTGNNPNAKPATTPSARAAMLTSPGVVSNIAVPNPGSRASTYAHSSSSGSVSKPKKAPLMQKTLALIKSTNRYRR